MFEIRDFRNARYQGEMQNGQPNGIGIVIDYNYLFCLAEWKDGLIDGPAFIVFPDSRIFCGRIYDNQLSGICSFYLQDKIQMFANYSQKQASSKNFIAVLPFCKVILEIDRQKSYPKASRHQTYTDQRSFISKLNTVFQKQVDLTEFKTWKDFLHINFIKPYPKKLYWKQNLGVNNEDYFLGLKYEGLGIRIINFIDDKQITACDGDCFLIASMGSYSNLHELKELGKQIVDYSKYKMQEEIYFGFKPVDIIQYPRKERPVSAQKAFVHELKSSIYFKNTFLDLKICYDLFKKYEKINVALMQENRKIAQIIIQNNDDSVILAQVENKKQRKLTPQKSERTIQSEYQPSRQLYGPPKAADPRYRMQGEHQMQRIPSETLSVNPEARKSIYSSVQKKKRNSSPRKPSEVTIQRYHPPQYRFNEPQYRFNEPSSFQKYSPERSTNQTYQNYSDSIQKVDKWNGNLNKNRQNKKYLYQAILEDPNSLKASYLHLKAQRSSPYLEKNSYNQPINYHSKEKSPSKVNDETVKKANRQMPAYNKRQISPNYLEKSRQQSPPLLKRQYNNERKTPILSNSNSQEDQDLINYFNKKIEDQNPPSYSELNKAFINDDNSRYNNNWTLGTTPKRQKTPGKIVTFKKRYDAGSIYQ